MPIRVIKGSIDYCFSNKKHLVLILLLLTLAKSISEMRGLGLVSIFVFAVIIMGYGLQITRDIINDGTELPKIDFRKIIIFGIKGTIIGFIYFSIQLLLLSGLSSYFNFPSFELEELFLNYEHTIHLFFTHDIVSCVLFIVFGFFIVYLTTFFMELDLARLADGGKLKNAFKLSKIKHEIDLIGWKKYTWHYTNIIIGIIILTYLMYFEIPILFIDVIFDSVISLLIVVVEFIGIGKVYKVYVDNKLNNQYLNKIYIE